MRDTIIDYLKNEASTRNGFGARAYSKFIKQSEYRIKINPISITVVLIQIGQELGSLCFTSIINYFFMNHIKKIKVILLDSKMYFLNNSK